MPAEVESTQVQAFKSDKAPAEIIVNQRLIICLLKEPSFFGLSLPWQWDVSFFPVAKSVKLMKPH